MTAAVGVLADRFRRESGHDPDITFGTVGALQAALAGGQTADVVILSGAAVATMERKGAVIAGRCRRLRLGHERDRSGRSRHHHSSRCPPGQSLH